jgi:hypothetical protein
MADTSEKAGSDEQEPQLPTAEPGILFADFPEDVTATETIRPEQDEVNTPVGTLTIEKIEVLETVPARAVEVTSRDYNAEARPADGEIFRILNLSYTADAGQAAEGEKHPYPVLALHSRGRYVHLSHLAPDQEHRVLISLPEDDEARLGVYFDGEAQFIDIATGEILDGASEPTVSPSE